MCWDAFRHVDNHNKSHMFQPKLPVWKNAQKVTGDCSQHQDHPKTPSSGEEVERWITIEMVRDKLNTNAFKNILEFDREM